MSDAEIVRALLDAERWVRFAKRRLRDDPVSFAQLEQAELAVKRVRAAVVVRGGER